MADQLFEQTELEIDPSKDYLPDLVGDDKKFKTPADLARSVLYKDSHISRLERENRELREDLVKRSTVDDLLEKLAPKLSTTVPNNAETTSHEQNQSGERINVQTQQALSKEDIKSILAEEREAERISKNLSVVKQTMLDALGNGAQAYITTKTKELGMSEDQALQLAKINPTAFLKLMDIDTVKREEQKLNSLFTPGKPSVNTTNMMSNKPTNGHKTFKEWQTVRRNNPAEYHQNYSKVHADALALGEAFYS